MALLSARFTLPSHGPLEGTQRVAGDIQPSAFADAGADLAVSRGENLQDDLKDSTRKRMVHSEMSQAVCFPRIELEDVEVTTVPVMVYFKIRVCPFSKGSGHHVMKTYVDLQNLNDALSRELPETTQLPKLPPQQSPKQLLGPAFRAWIGSYLACLACSRDALATYSFQNFFQLSEEYHRWESRPVAPCEPRIGSVADMQAQGLVTKRSTLLRAATLPGAADPTSALSRAKSTLLVARQSGERTAQSPRRSEVATPQVEEVAPVARGRTQSAEPRQETAGPSSDVRVVPQTSPATISHLPQGSSFSSNEFGSSAETSAAGGRRSHRRRPWCIVCMASPQEVALDPCGHMSMCHTCANEVKECPLCRGPIQKILRVYLA